MTSRLRTVLATVLLLNTLGCADFEKEAAAFCEQNPSRCGHGVDIAPLSVVAGSTHSLALRGDGTVWAWGDNSVGQLGDGTTAQRASPVQVPDLTNVIALAAGGSHSLALRGDRAVWGWGYNKYGQLGDGTAETMLVPVRALLP